MRQLRAAGGLLLILVGLLWILQGINVVGGSGMSGQGQYAVLGIIVALVGAWLLRSAVWVRRRSGDGLSPGQDSVQRLE